MQAVSYYELGRLGPGERRRLLVRSEEDLGPIIEKVRPIIEAVRRHGDRALIDFALKFDRARVSRGRLKAPEADFSRAFRRLSREVISSIEFGIAKIGRAHV